MKDLLLQLGLDLQDEKILRVEAQYQALEWHDFVCWLKEDKKLPIESLLKEWKTETIDNYGNNY